GRGRRSPPPRNAPDAAPAATRRQRADAKIPSADQSYGNCSTAPTQRKYESTPQFYPIPDKCAKSDRPLVLLCHKRWLKFLCRETAWQHGHRYKDFARAIVNRLRIVAIELATWRSGRIGGA